MQRPFENRTALEPFVLHGGDDAFGYSYGCTLAGAPPSEDIPMQKTKDGLRQHATSSAVCLVRTDPMGYMRCLLALCAAVWSLAGCVTAAEYDLEHRWLFVMRNHQRAENVARTLALFPRAQAAGYNGVVISEGGIYNLDTAEETYRQNLLTLQREARRHGLELIPAVMPIGYSGGILSVDPNLVEGIPVKDAVFVVHDGQAALRPPPEAALPGGSFEEVDGDTFAGWDWQDNAGESIYADHRVVHGGNTSVRLEGIPEADPEHGHCRFNRTIMVSPFRQYRLSVWIKTQDFEAPETAKMTVLAPTEEERSISFAEFEIEPTQDWTKYSFVFNSLNWEKVRLYFGTWEGKEGRIWWDDMVLEEVGLLNVLRRDGCPVSVHGADGTVYTEGVDYQPIRDPQLSPYRTDHTPPPIVLTEASRISDGAELLVSYYHAIVIGKWQVTCCLSDPKVYDILRHQVQQVEDVLHPSAFFMQHDEIRVGNRDKACQDRHLAPGELLADNARKSVQIIHDINPDAKIWVWSDMFDPNHNAVDNYYLVNGTWAGSWEGLDPDVGIVNWANHLKGKNLKWFADRGHEQVLAGYYDNDEWVIGEWLEAGKGLRGITGAMYTTWTDDYSDMETWAKTAWGSAATEAPAPQSEPK